MPRKSPFAIFLTDSERDALESAARRYTSPHNNVIRAKIILMAEQDSTTMKLQAVQTYRVKLSANGAYASMKALCRVCRTSRVEAVRALFPPAVIVEIKALFCELSNEFGIPLPRFQIAELRREVINRGIVAKISGTTIWRWLTEDAIKPQPHHSWIFPRDPHSEIKAGRVLDLCEGVWENWHLGNKDL